jgi:hypothetical protein
LRDPSRTKESEMWDMDILNMSQFVVVPHRFTLFTRIALFQMWTFPIVGEWRHWLGRHWNRAKVYLKLALDMVT